MIKSRKVSNHVTITLTKDEMVYLQRLANLDNVVLAFPSLPCLRFALRSFVISFSHSRERKVVNDGLLLVQFSLSCQGHFASW